MVPSPHLHAPRFTQRMVQLVIFILGLLATYALILMMSCRDASIHFRGIDADDDREFWQAFRNRLYFSTITVSTIGYGDVVPVSERARLLSAAAGVLVVSGALSIATRGV